MPLPFRRFMLVCTGNVCRSPMAERSMQQRLKGSANFTVASSGIGALVDQPADKNAVAVMRERGLGLEGHRGRQLDLEFARGFDLLLVMEDSQQRWIEQRMPVLRGRVKRLGHWLDLEVPDPYGLPVEAFRETRDLIEKAVDSWVERIDPRASLT
jgi:protein-tyrosine phosphatase